MKEKHSNIYLRFLFQETQSRNVSLNKLPLKVTSAFDQYEKFLLILVISHVSKHLEIIITKKSRGRIFRINTSVRCVRSATSDLSADHAMTTGVSVSAGGHTAWAHSQLCEKVRVCLCAHICQSVIIRVKYQYKQSLHQSGRAKYNSWADFDWLLWSTITNLSALNWCMSVLGITAPEALIHFSLERGSLW